MGKACITAKVPVTLLRGLSDMTDDSLEGVFCRGFLAGPDKAASLEDHVTRFLRAAAGAMLFVRARPLSGATPRLLLVSAKAASTVKACLYIPVQRNWAGMQSEGIATTHSCSRGHR